MPHTPDDIRYMSHEVRIAEGYMKAPAPAPKARTITTCSCGKTVTHVSDKPVMLDGKPVTCPRGC